jgi:hypothetical protein
MNDKEFLQKIGFEICPVTNATVNVYPGKHITQNTIYKSDKINDSNFITIRRTNPKNTNTNTYGQNNFSLNGVKNGVCFWIVFLIEGDKFSMDPHEPLFIDINKAKYSELNVEYFIKNEDFLIKKSFKDKFSSIKEFWDYLDTFKEFQTND